MSQGAIPWDKTIDYARYMGLDDEVVAVFWRIIHAMDDVYLEWMDEQSERRRKQSQSSIGNKAVEKKVG